MTEHSPDSVFSGGMAREPQQSAGVYGSGAGEAVKPNPAHPFWRQVKVQNEGMGG